MRLVEFFIRRKFLAHFFIIYLCSLFWGVSKSESENIPKQPDLVNASVGKKETKRPG